MTSAAVFPSLEVPAQEDSMEVSSPADRLYDDGDIDIDFDDHIGGVQLTDDERMMEDDEQTGEDAVADDIMEDDAQPAEGSVQEQEMQDGFDPTVYEQADPDDELIDYGEEEYEEPTQYHDNYFSELAPPAPDVEVTDQQSPDEETEQVDEEIVREPEAPEPESAPVAVEETVVQPEVTATEPELLAEVATAEKAPTPAEVPATKPRDATTAVAADVQYFEPPAASQDGAVEATALTNNTEAATPNVQTEKPTIQVPTPAALQPSASFDVEAPGTPTDTGLHPVTVHFNGSHWPLFKSKNQPEGLVKDDNLASVGLAELLANCRQRLLIKTGGDFPEESEATVSFDSMGLDVSENHPACFSTSLHEILEVYKQLHANDNVDSTPALALTVSLTYNFSTRFASLKEAAAGGQGLSYFNPEQYVEDYTQAFDEFAQDDKENAETVDETAAIEDAEHPEQQYQGYTASAEVQQPQEATYSDVAHEGTAHQYGPSQSRNQGQEENEDQYEEHAYEEGAQEEQGPEAQGEQPQNYYNTAAESESYPQAEDHAGQESDEASPEAEADHHDERRAEGAAADAAEAPSGEGEVDGEKEGTNVESAASSTTLRGDPANVSVGEYYDDNPIDYDHSCLTSDSSEHGEDGHDDFLNLLTEPNPEGPEEHPSGDAVEEPEAYEDPATHADVGEAKEAVDDGSFNATNEVDHSALQEHQESLVNSHADDHQGTDGLHQHSYLEGQHLAQHNEGHAEDAEQGDGLYDERDQNEQAEDDDQYYAAYDIIEGNSVEQGAEQVVTGGSGEFAAVEDPTGGNSYPAAGSEGTPADLEDDIDFDDDTTEQHEARKATQQRVTNDNTNSPLGKRSFDETETVDEGDEPELKKARSS